MREILRSQDNQNEQDNVLVPPHVLHNARIARDKRRNQFRSQTPGKVDIQHEKSTLSETDAIQMAHNFHLQYSGKTRELAEDYKIRKLKIGKSSAASIYKMRDAVAQDEALEVYNKSLHNLRGASKEALYKTVCDITKRPDAYSLSYRLALFEVYLLKVGPRAVK